MTNEQRGQLRSARQRMLRLLIDIEELEEGELMPLTYRGVIAARLREVARLATAQCYYLEPKKEETNAPV